MTQAILKFQLESTNEKLTPRTGVVILGEYLKGMKLKELCNVNLQKAKRNNGYSAFEFIYPLVLMLHSGGRVLDDIREIKVDKALTTLLKIENIPTANAVSKYLRKYGVKFRLCLSTIKTFFKSCFIYCCRSTCFLFLCLCILFRRIIFASRSYISGGLDSC